MSAKRIREYPPNPHTTRGSSTKLGSNGDNIIYANGKSIVIRDLSGKGNVVVYSGHVHPTTVARISPSGYYVASADTQGNVRIWDAVATDQVLKAEYKVLGGKINDLSWDGESKRIIAVGDGREKFGHVFQFDSGSSAGEIVGHAKSLNAVAIRHQRPFRAATAGDDGLVILHTGAPYKYDKTLKAHTNFVHSVAYSSSGTHFVSVGSDARVFLWDGLSGERAAEFVDGVDGAHRGSVYAGTWASDNKSIITSSADCTVKLWDVEVHKATTKWTLGSGVEYQQMGNTWTSSGLIVSLSMGGILNVFDPREGVGPTKLIHGPQKAITSTATSVSSSTFFAGSADGRLHSFSVTDVDAMSECERVSGPGHTNLVSGIVSTGASTWSAGFDDCVRELRVHDKDVVSFSNVTHGPTASQPKAVAVSDDEHVFVAEAGHVEVLRSGQRVCVVEAAYGAISVDVSGEIVVVGGEDAKVHLYSWNSNGTLTPSGRLEGSNKGSISAVAFAPNGSLLAAGDSTGKIVVYDMKERKALISRWTFHNSRIHSLAWTANGAHLASGSLDTHIYVWSIAKPTRNIAIKNAGPGGVWGVRWVPSADIHTQAKLLSAGADGAVRMWEVVFHV